ncbi:efflux transporter outer membrane subunit [Actinobacillus pleuropneumoniae]|uniref:efflux transporter outer membrane subunit n=1 Tax=Actinobacillus pleuropneumoniae TaxID=715 RepID=UPI00384E9DE1
MKIEKYTSFAIFCLILTACHNQDVAKLQSDIELPAQFEYANTANKVTNIRQWWKNWQDPQLTALIEQGLQHNLDIKLAQARLAETQAYADYRKADQGINIGASGSTGAGVSDVNLDRVNPDRKKISDIYGGINLSWELDFFGKKQSEADKATSLALAQQEQIYAAQMLITGEIANNYFRIIATDKQNNNLTQQLTALQALKRYIQGRFNAGQATAYELNEIDGQISAIQAKQSTLSAQADEFQRNIAILIGKTPQAFRLQKNRNALIKIPNTPSGTQPSSLLDHRPDLRAAKQQVQAQAANLASKQADLYPRFDITFQGQGGYLKLDQDLGNISSLAGLASLGVQLPIFTNGRIAANIEAAQASLKAALIQYDKTLLTALAEVDSAYQQQYALNNQNHLLQKYYQQANKQAIDSEKLFKYGDKTLDVALRAKIAAYSTQEKLIQSQLSQAQNLIRLYKSIGGGW